MLLPGLIAEKDRNCGLLRVLRLQKHMRQLQTCREHFACVCYQRQIAQLKTSLKEARAKLEKLEPAADKEREQPSRRRKRSPYGATG